MFVFGLGLAVPVKWRKRHLLTRQILHHGEHQLRQSRSFWKLQNENRICKRVWLSNKDSKIMFCAVYQETAWGFAPQLGSSMKLVLRRVSSCCHRVSNSAAVVLCTESAMNPNLILFSEQIQSLNAFPKQQYRQKPKVIQEEMVLEDQKMGQWLTDCYEALTLQLFCLV